MHLLRHVMGDRSRGLRNWRLWRRMRHGRLSRHGSHVLRVRLGRDDDG